MKKKKKFVTMNQTKYNKKKYLIVKKKNQINRFPLMLMIDNYILTDEWSTQSRKVYFEIFT